MAALTLCAALVLDALRPLRPAPCGRAWKELDLDALRHNARTLRSALSPGCTLMAVVKADGYGHGAVPVARCLRRDGVRAFGVACLAEGIALRKAGVLGTILILGYTPPREVPLLRRWHLTQTVADEAHGRALAAQGGPVRVHLALDTGMHRLGLPAGDRSAIARMYRLKNLRIDGVFSHLCVSDSLKKEDMDATLEQLTLFYDTLDWMRTQNLSPGRVHIQASYGVLNLPPQPCTWARAGIALYGVYSSLSPVQRRLDLKPVLSLRARVASVRTLRPGERAGYGLAFQARQETRLAVVHRLRRRPAPPAAPAGRACADPRRFLSHGGTDVHGPAAGGCHRPARCPGRGCGHPHRPGRSAGAPGRGAGRPVRHHHQ